MSIACRINMAIDTNTHIIVTTYCVSTATVVAPACLNVTLYVYGSMSKPAGASSNV
jgi:hypothetical protein